MSRSAGLERAIGLLELGPGDTVLDIACGPGNFVREAPNVAYLRGDAIRLPFRDGASTRSAASPRCTCSTSRSRRSTRWRACSRRAAVSRSSPAPARR